MYHTIGEGDDRISIEYFRAFWFVIIGVYHSPNPIAAVVTTGLTKKRVAEKMLKEVHALWENY